MIASLPMYDRPENMAAHDALWALIRNGLRDRGLDAPDALDRATDHMEGWGRPDLVLGQICNLPYRALFRDRVTAIGCADYGLSDTPAGHYRSLFVVREDDPAKRPEDCDGYRLAYNEGMSQSGWGTAWAWSQARGMTLRPALQTGAHRASVAAVAEGRADWAAVDAISFRNMAGRDPGAARLRVIGRTDPSPGMTFITRPGQNPAPYFAAISDAIAALPAEHRDEIGLRAIVALPPSAYDLPLPPNPASLPL
ncbi:MAG: PhnD/SsuA/transferrin family substrate-binding protein [Limimaricola sp.]|uniref:phosphate/phosphite/phosphonate ABC transporter substrate-binding protein n=1 Tax=Limimaricola sp. TaxID=2211665 RepID=UPI001DB8F437|nr:PhnD/SsuA/transferrin family substrate-binding protein [Limimaricola sp.]MBI1416535.1 PhnD/SsuA/transferrin family substrate-binding protein [Limimaricola sp.]